MALFPKDSEFDSGANSAPSRMRWIREQGTRRLLIGVAVVTLVWLSISQVYDRWLLQKHWEQLAPKATGLNVIGTLNSRESYDRNLFKIINANKSSRVVITEYGWKSVFDERNGPLFSDRVGNAIRAARQQDGVIGDAMLSPFLRATVRHQMGDESAYKSIREDMPLFIPRHTKGGTDEKTTLGELIRRYEGLAENGADPTQNDGGGSGSGHDKEDTITVGTDTLLASCPVILTDADVEAASLEEVPGNILTPTTYTIHLNLSGEGRSRFFQWSHDHINENVVFVLNGEVIAAPRITQTLNVSDFAISNVQDLPGAKALVAFFSKQH